MKAMILAAGLGTRLRPLTDDRPKALVEVAGRTLLELALCRLKEFGVREVIVNVHHFADMVLEYLAAQRNFGLRIEISREEVLLDTGGGLKKAAWFFLEPNHSEEPFLLHNVDVLSTIDLRRMLRHHEANKALATLAVQARDSSRALLFDSQMRLCGRRPGRDQEPEMARSCPQAEPLAFCGIHVISPRLAEKLALIRRDIEGCRSVMARSCPQAEPLAFCGIHVISPRLFSLMDEEGVFSILAAYLRLASQGESLIGFRADEQYWRDLGRPESLAQAEEDVRRKVLSW